jgi:integrase
MASIRVLKTGAYQVMFRQDGKQRSTCFFTEAEAINFKTLVEIYGPARASMVLTGDAPEPLVDAEPPGPTLAEYLDRHVAELTSASSATKANYRQYVNSLRDGIGTRPLAELSTRDVQGWVAAMQKSKTRSGKTIKNHLAFVAGALNRAVEQGELPMNPCRGVRSVDASRKVEPVFLTAEQVRKIADVCGPHEGLVMWLAGTGMRYSEATALTVNDVDLKAGTARVSKAWKKDLDGMAARGDGMVLGPPKSRRSVRTVNVPKYVLEAAASDLERPAGELVFQNSIGNRVNIDSFRSWYWSPAVAGMVPRPRIHDLRHTCASLMIAAGVPLPSIQAHLGHESINTTVGIYGHLDRQAGAQAAAAIDAAFRGNP